MNGRKRHIFYRLELLLVMIGAALFLYIGSSVVSVNCGNMINGTDTVFFDVYFSDGGLTFVFMDKEYSIG